MSPDLVAVVRAVWRWQRRCAALGQNPNQAELEQWLYRFYGGWHDLDPARPAAPAAVVAEWVEALSAANRGRGTEIGGLAADTTEWRRFGLRWRLPPHAVRDGEPRRGHKELRWLHHGYYFLLGDRDLDLAATGHLRVYWHVRAAAAVPWVAAISQGLSSAGIAFRAKILADPRDYVRADAAILYLPRDSWSQLAPILRQLYHELSPGLRAAVPRFTRKLAPGLAWADDPADHTSFGEQRCRWVAQALWPPAADLSSGISRLRATFVAAGLDPAKPHLAPGAADLPAFSWRRPARRVRRLTPFELALQVGELLEAQALSWGDRCTWLTRWHYDPVPVQTDPVGIDPVGIDPVARRPVKRAMGPGLGDGLAGLALFLSELALATDGPTPASRWRRLAAAAAAQAAFLAEPMALPLAADASLRWLAHQYRHEIARWPYLSLSFLSSGSNQLSLSSLSSGSNQHRPLAPSPLGAPTTVPAGRLDLRPQGGAWGLSAPGLGSQIVAWAEKYGGDGIRRLPRGWTREIHDELTTQHDPDLTLADGLAGLGYALLFLEAKARSGEGALSAP